MTFKNGLNISAKGNVDTSKNMNDSNTTTKYEHEDIDVDYGSLTKSAAITVAIAGVSEVASEKILEMSKNSGKVVVSKTDGITITKELDYKWIKTMDDNAKKYAGLEIFGHDVYPGLGFGIRQSIEALVPSEKKNDNTNKELNNDILSKND